MFSRIFLKLMHAFIDTNPRPASKIGGYIFVMIFNFHISDWYLLEME